MRLDLVMAVAGDQRHAARNMVRIERVEQAQQHLGLEAGAALHANRIADPAQIFDMRRSLEAGAVANPQNMARGVEIGRASCREGVCKLVESTWVGKSLKKNNRN